MEAFTAAGRSLYQSCIPAGDDWDIFLACEVSVAAQRAMNDGRELVRTLTYGELDFEALAAIIYSIKYNHGYLMEGAKFYDLGSGTGKAVIAAACLHSFSTCVGVELLEGLHRVALTHKATWDAGETEGRPAVEFLQGSILDWAAGDWSDGDVLFANSHCFSEDMMQDISAKAGLLKPGSYFITTTMELDSEKSGFSEVERIRVDMSWGSAVAVLYRKDAKDTERNNRAIQSIHDCH